MFTLVVIKFDNLDFLIFMFLVFNNLLNSFWIKGVSKAKNYESFIRRLTYVTMNSHNIENSKFLKSKQFFVSCIRNDPIIETNTIIIQVINI